MRTVEDREVYERHVAELSQSPWWTCLDAVDQGFILGVQDCETGSRCGCRPCVCINLRRAASYTDDEFDFDLRGDLQKEIFQ